MIESVWKPKFIRKDGLKIISHYELTTSEKMIEEKKTGWIVRYYCDKCKSCNLHTTKSKVFFSEDVYLNTLKNQMCRSCRSRYSEYEVKKKFISFDFFEKSLHDSCYELITKKEEYDLAENKSQFKMNVVCKNGHKHTTTWNNWKKNKRCRVCYEKNKFENSLKNKKGWDRYYFLVWSYSERNYIENKEIINPKKY